MAKNKKAKKQTEKPVEPKAQEKAPEPVDEYDYTDEVEFKPDAVVKPNDKDEETPDPEDDKDDHVVEVKALDDDLLTRAVQAGMTIKEAKAFGTDEALTTALAAIERAVQKAAPKAEAKAEVDDFKIELDPDLYEPEVIKAFEGMQASFKAALAANQTRLDSVLDEFTKREQRDSEQRIDGMFNALGGDWKDVFGEGPTSGLRKTSEHARNRVKVMDHMAMIEAGAKSLGRDVPADLFHNTVESVFSEHSSTLTDAADRKVMTTRMSQALVPPTNRNGKPIAPEQQAVENLRARMLDAGLDPSDDGYDYEEEQAAFPD